MSDLIALIHSEMDIRRLQKTQEDSTLKWRARRRQVGRPAPPVSHPAPRAHLSAPRCYVESPPPPRLHLCHPLSRFDPRAHVGRSGLYNQPLPPSRACCHKLRVDHKLGFLERREQSSNSSSFWYRLASKVQVEFGLSLRILDLPSEDWYSHCISFIYDCATSILCCYLLCSQFALVICLIQL